MKKRLFSVIDCLILFLLWSTMAFPMGLGGGGGLTGQDPNIQHLMSIEGPKAPVRVAVSRNGDIYVTDTSANRMLIFDRKGNLKKEIDHLNQPLGIMVDRSNFIYMGESGKGAVSVFDNQGRFLRYLGTGPGQFSMPNDIVADPDGYIYVVDSLEDCVKKFDPAGRFVSQFGAKGSGTGQFNFPIGISYDPLNDRLLITDQNNARIQAFSRSGTYLTSFNSSNRLEGLTVDPKGRIYVVDAFQGRGQSFNLDGTSRGYFGSFGTGAGQLRLPSDVSFHPTGWLIASSTNTGRLEVYQLLDTLPTNILPPPELTPIPAGTIFTPYDHISWGGSYDPGITFAIQIANNAEFTNPITLEGISATKLSLRQLLTLLKEKGYVLQDNTNYWWRIKAVAPDGNESDWANGGYFTFNIIYLEVKADPSVVRLFVDSNINFEGYYMGNTPLTVGYLPAARFYLSLAQAGYEDRAILVDMSNGQDQSVSSRLKAGLRIGFDDAGEILRDSSGSPIYLTNPVPLIVDWNNDGVRDLLVGEGTGRMLLFLREKTGEEISLTPGTNLSFSGSEQWAEALAAPFVADFNGDFKKDLLVGSASGQVFLYINEGTDEEPQFYQRRELTAQGNRFLAPANAVPAVADWDGDGRPDLLVGTGEGKVIFYRNLGGSSEIPELALGKAILYQGEPLHVGTEAKPLVTDFDRDGRKDLIVGAGDGRLYLFVNSNSGQGAGEPIFNTKARLLLPDADDEGNIPPGMAPTLAEWDSKPGRDVIIGNALGEVRVYPGEVEGFAGVYLTILKAELDVMNDYIQSLPDSAFDKNPSQRKQALANKVEALKKIIAESELEEAIDKLANDLAKKWTPGNAESWIIDQNAQNYLTALANGLIGEMEQALRDAGR